MGARLLREKKTAVANNSMKEEGAAYISALNLKEGFEKGGSPADFHPDALEKTALAMEKQRDTLEALCEKMSEEELLREFAQVRREIKGYVSVLRNIQQLPGNEAQLWDAVRFYLAPTDDTLEPPGTIRSQEAIKLMRRICGFSKKSAEFMELNIKAREAHEKEKIIQLNKAKQSAKGKGGGFLKKLGF